MTRATAHMEKKRRNEKQGLMTCLWVYLFVFPFLFSSWSKSVGAQQAGRGRQKPCLQGTAGFGNNRSTHKSRSRQAD